MSKCLKVVISTLVAVNVIASFGVNVSAATNDSVVSSSEGRSEGALDINDNSNKVSESRDAAEDNGLTEKTKDGVILHAWCWSFNTIKDNMKDIAEAGYSSVQTSPANNCVVGDGGGMDIYGNGKWHFHYQPTDWKIGNYQLGSKDDFTAMCNEAKKYGVKIIVDVVPNHTTTDLGAISDDLKKAFTSGKMFHSRGFDNINDYNDRNQCTLMAVGGLPDVNTEDPGFQKYFLGYLNDLIDCGASGFRYDTAKHIGLPDDPQDSPDLPNTFWPIVTGQKDIGGLTLKNKDNLFIYGEVLQDKNVRETDYAKYISMTASDYGWKVDSMAKDRNMDASKARDWTHKCSPDKLVTWVESHDTYCNAGNTADLTDWQIKTAWSIIAARDSGTPLFYDRPAGSNGKQNRWGNNKIGEKGSDLFKDPEVVAVNKFRNAMVGEKENIYNPEGNNKVLIIERGDKGATIINADKEADISCETKLADGVYKDTVSGKEATVENGILKFHVDKEKVACIYNGKASTAPSVSASSKETKFKTETLDVTLNCKNVKDATYSIDGAEKTSYKDGQVIKLGKDAEYDTPIKLVVEGTGEDGKTVSNEYTYSKADPDECTRAYLKLPKDWKDAYIYLYDGTESSKNNGEWPGAKMTKVEGQDDLYYYDIPEGYTKPSIIFNDGVKEEGGKKFPDGDKAPGKEISGPMIYDGTDYKKYVKSSPVEDKKEIKINKFEASEDIKVNSEAKVSLSAEGGNGDLSYSLKVTDSSDKEVYTDEGKLDKNDKDFTFTPKSEGTYKAKITITDEKDQKQDKEVTFKVNKEDVTEKDDPIKINSIGVNDNDKIELGESFKIAINAEGGKGKLSYKITVKDDNQNTVKESDKDTLNWTPESDGDYKVSITVSDEKDNKETKTVSLKVNKEKQDEEEAKLEITSFNVTDGEKGQFKLNANAKNGKGEISYKFYNITDGKENLIQSSKDDKASALWTGNENGTYTFKVVCEDENKTKVEKTVTKTLSSIQEKNNDENKIPDVDVKDENETKKPSDNKPNKEGDKTNAIALMLSIVAGGVFINKSVKKNRN